MGLVYKARQPKLDRLVALKLLSRASGADPAFGERFNREARVLARLSHPNIVAVHDFGQAGAFYYLVMEFVDGVNLRQAMRAGRFKPAQALALVPKICDALQYAHEEGVLHRDIKPENLLLDTRGRVKIADFGIAKLQGEARDITLTASGAALGTPHYMAPEQLEHPQDVDQRADIYSLGVVFYEMLTGELPLGRFAPPSEKSLVDARIDAIVFRTLEKERERRFQSAGEVKTQVENVTANPAPPGSGSAAKAGSPTAPSNGPRWSRRAIAAAALTGVGFLMFWTSMNGGSRGGPSAFLLSLLAIGGVGMGWAALRDIQQSGGQLRGRRLALFAAAVWPVALVDVLLFVGFARVFFGPMWFFSHPTLRVLVALGILVLNGLVLRYWLRNRERGDALFLATELLNRLADLPRKARWLTAAGCLLFLLFVTVRSRQRDTYEPPAQTAPPPAAPPGYEASEGLIPANGRVFESTLTVPAGYALTVTATLSSNQVVVRRGEPAASAFIIAPPGRDAQASLKWRMLGNTTVADGAPLEFSLGLTREGESPRTRFQFTSPEPFPVDWVSEPRQLWPPQNGHTKFLLAHGAAAAARPAVRPPVAIQASPDGTPPVDVDGPTPIEWAIGIETRLDPLPSSMQKMDHPEVGGGTNWLKAVEAETSANPPESPAPEPAAPPAPPRP